MPNGTAFHARVTALSGSGATVLAARPHRFMLALCAFNETCYVTFDGSTPSATNGIPLYAEATGITIGNNDAVPATAVKAFSVGGTGVIHALETYIGGN